MRDIIYYSSIDRGIMDSINNCRKHRFRDLLQSTSSGYLEYIFYTSFSVFSKPYYMKESNIYQIPFISTLHVLSNINVCKLRYGISSASICKNNQNLSRASGLHALLAVPYSCPDVRFSCADSLESLRFLVPSKNHLADKNILKKM